MGSYKSNSTVRRHSGVAQETIGQGIAVSIESNISSLHHKKGPGEVSRAECMQTVPVLFSHPDFTVGHRVTLCQSR